VAATAGEGHAARRVGIPGIDATAGRATRSQIASAGILRPAAGYVRSVVGEERRQAQHIENRGHVSRRADNPKPLRAFGGGAAIVVVGVSLR